MSPKKRSKRRGSQETERVSTRARSPEVDESSCVPDTQQEAGVEELVVGVEDPLEMLDTEKGFRFRFICCFTSRSTARVILRRVVYRWRKPVHTVL